MRIFFALMLCASLLCVSCGGDDDGAESKATPVTLTGISLTSKPSKTVYFLGEEFDKSGMVVTARYSDGTERDVTDSVEIFDFNSENKDSCQEITVAYAENSGIFKAYCFVEVTDYPCTKDRILTLSFQYYKYDYATGEWGPYTYSEDPTDDINGTVTFKFSEYGITYYTDKNSDLGKFYMYYPPAKEDAVWQFQETNGLKPMKYMDTSTGMLKTISTASELWQCYGDNIPLSYLYSWLCWRLIPYTFYGNSMSGDDGVSIGCVSPAASIKGKPKWIHLEEELMNASFSESTYPFMGEKYPKIERDKNGTITKGVLSRQAFLGGNFHVLITLETELPPASKTVYFPIPGDLYNAARE